MWNSLSFFKIQLTYLYVFEKLICGIQKLISLKIAKGFCNFQNLLSKTNLKYSQIRFLGWIL